VRREQTVSDLLDAATQIQQQIAKVDADITDANKPLVDLDNQILDMIHPDVAYSGGITGCRKIADYAALTRTPVGLHSGPCSLVRFYASVHLSAAIQNFFKIENVVGEFRGFKEKMAAGKPPVVRKSVMQYPDGPGLGLEINEDWLRQHMAKGETWWG